MHAPDLYRPAVLLLYSLAGLSLSLITELLSHTFPLVLPFPSALAMPYLEMLDSSVLSLLGVNLFLFCYSLFLLPSWLAFLAALQIRTLSFLIPIRSLFAL